MSINIAGWQPLPSDWVDYLDSQSETGMDYQVVDIFLKDGDIYRGVVHSGGLVNVVFDTADIEDIIVTHDRGAVGTCITSNALPGDGEVGC